MVCPACGKANAEGVSFCEFCGASVRLAAATAGGPTIAIATPTPSAAEVAQMGKQLGKSFVSSLSLGEKFVGVGAIAATLGFFMPFISAPDLGELGSVIASINPAAQEATHASVSLFAATKLLGAIYFILLTAIASGVLFYLGRNAPAAKKMLMGGFQVMIGSLLGPGFVFALLFVPMIQSVAGAGYWLLTLGYCSIAAGGLITIGTLGKTTH